MRRWFSKEVPDMPVYVAGFPLKFDILETEDAALIAELDKCVAKGIGGVISITEEQYNEELAKKNSGIQSPNSSKPRRYRQELSALQIDARRVVEAAARQAPKTQAPQRGLRPDLPTSGRPMPDPIEVPSASSFSSVFLKPPPTARVKEAEPPAKEGS